MNRLILSPLEVVNELDIVQDLHNISVQSVFILLTLSIFGVYTKHFGSWFCVCVHAELGTLSDWSQ